MSKKNYFKERIMLLILLFAFMTPFGALAQTIQLTGSGYRCCQRTYYWRQCSRERYNQRGHHRL